VTDEAAGGIPVDTRHKALLGGRVAIVYALTNYSLFLPFAALCMASALLQQNAAPYMTLPFLLLIGATVGGYRLKDRYDRRTADDDPKLWAQRYTILSGVIGAFWGLGAILWFDFASFVGEAYLVLAFLGLSATEFIARAVYRPAYLAHAAGSLGSLAVMLTLQGGLYQTLSAMLVIFFGGVLYTYGGSSLGGLLDDTILLRYDNEQLIARLNQEKRLAEATRDSAKESERTKSVFISNISHELRTPLNAMLGMAQILERGDLEKAQRDHLKVLLEAGRGLKTLLDDIIALANQTDDVPASLHDGCDSAQAARTVVRLLQPNAWEKRLRLSINVAPGLPRVAADPRLLRRVLLKLIGNAIKFTDRGNIEIALDTTADAAERIMVRFAVTDTGPGIPSHLLAAVFEPFAKADQSYAATKRGAGVGLAVAKRLIESIGGTIGVESEPGMGASFWITIPAAQANTIEEGHEGEPVTPPTGLSLLGYVPDAAMRAELDRLLAPFGNRIVFMDSLAQAAATSARGSFAAVLAIASAADALAAAPGQRTPILALAASDENLPAGSDSVLRWPAMPAALYAAVHAVSGETRISEPQESSIDSMIDAKAIAELEKTLGFKTLIDILQTYLTTAEQLAAALSDASKREDWPQAGRFAQDFAGAAGGLGLTAITSAARTLAQGARDGAEVEELSTAASNVLSEHGRVRDALRRLYPDLSA
jgi:signal transduction histidine kinase/HPt (histidine-containing phosphotransfer) domain-containing protein